MAQVIAKEYECMTCHTQIRISKIDNVEPDAKKKWNKFELDGVTPHVCRKAKLQHERPTIQRQPPNSSNLSKEIVAIKIQLVELVSRLDRIERDMMRH